MNAAVRNYARGFAFVVAAAALNAPPCEASELLDARPWVGLPSVAVGDRQAVAWRRVGGFVESDLIDVEATISTRIASDQGAAFALDMHPGCTDACNDRTALGHDIGLTLKIPRWHAGAPFIDVGFRRWSMDPLLTSDGERATGTTAKVAFAQPVGSMDALFGFSTPVGFSGSQSAWTSAYAGLAWHAGPGTRWEFIADRSVQSSSGLVDRTISVRLVHAAPSRNVRFGAWTTRSLDNHSDSTRLGAGIDYSF